jgi:putative hydrolase of the HAD superfamily
VPEEQCEALAIEVDHGVRGYSWAYVGIGAVDGLRAVAALGLPMGVVSNSNGTVESDLRRLGVCYAPQTPEVPDAREAPDARELTGVPVGVVIDSAVVGVAKPDPAIFSIALNALHVPPGRTVLHVGDSLRYDVAGALAAGLQPVHLDPYGFCPEPAGHPHIRSLADLPPLVTG